MASANSFFRVSILTLSLTAVTASVLLFTQRSGDEAERPVRALTAPVPDQLENAAAPADPELPGQELLRDVAINGSIDLHPDGSLAYTLALRHLFDHFLSMAGTAAAVPAARYALAAHIDSQGFSKIMKEAALAAFDRYVDYLNQASTITLDAYEPATMARTFGRLAELRRAVLGRELAKAFFGEDEAKEAYLTDHRRIATDPTLTAEERTRQLAALEKTLPEDMQQARRQATAVIRLRDETHALRKAGASNEVIHYMREEQLGPEAAGRLRALDERRADWERRLARYHQERDALMSSPALADQDREQFLAELRSQHFTASEIRRVRALDRLALAGMDSVR